MIQGTWYRVDLGHVPARSGQVVKAVPGFFGFRVGRHRARGWGLDAYVLIHLNFDSWMRFTSSACGTSVSWFPKHA